MSSIFLRESTAFLEANLIKNNFLTLTVFFKSPNSLYSQASVEIAMGMELFFTKENSNGEKHECSVKLFPGTLEVCVHSYPW